MELAATIYNEFEFTFLKKNRLTILAAEEELKKLSCVNKISSSIRVEE